MTAAQESSLPWIQVAPGSPYFITEEGDAWTPIGQNDAVTWPDLAGLFRRRDLPAVEGHLRWLRAHGVTCLRLMLEYTHGENRYLERPIGRFQPNMVRLWDDLFPLCERHALRILLTPFDTFWMWRRWAKHPLNRRNGGPCPGRNQWLLCRETRAAIKARVSFATERWGGSGALFAWDLWNEIHPAHAGDSAEVFGEFIDDVGGFLRDLETRLYGRAHPQTVSVFGPSLALDPRVGEAAFRHPALDFASTHFYEKGTIDDPKNTVDAAISAGRLTREALAEIGDLRPFFESEHGPIHAFKDRRKTLPEPFDDEYFRHIQWAHFASGGAGGGMRWPNRHPHTLTHGMRAAQRALACFTPLIDWTRFRRRNLNEELQLSQPLVAGFACGDEEQAVVWMLRRDIVDRRGLISREVEPLSCSVDVPGLRAGHYQVSAFDTAAGTVMAVCEHTHAGGGALELRRLPVASDVALAVRRVSG